MYLVERGEAGDDELLVCFSHILMHESRTAL